MDLIFKRVGQKRYAIEAIPDGMPVLEMNPAPGYDPYLPHDLLHATVEAVLDLKGAVFGQLASGGDAGTFHPKMVGSKSRDASRLSRRLRKKGIQLSRAGEAESLLSERAAYVCWQEWLSRSADPALKSKSKTMVDSTRRMRALMSPGENEALDREMDRICTHLDQLSACWSQVKVGGSIHIHWPDLELTC